MTISANSGGSQVQVECSAQAFFRGLFRLVSTPLFANAGWLATCVAVVLAILPLCLPMGPSYIAWVAVGTFSASFICFVLAYIVKKFEVTLGVAALIMFMAHMFFSLATVMGVDARLPPGQTWWEVSSTLVKAAILPTYLFAMTLHFAAALGAVVLVGWGLLKLLRAMPAIVQYICKAGQAK